MDPENVRAHICVRHQKLRLDGWIELVCLPCSLTKEADNQILDMMCTIFCLAL